MTSPIRISCFSDVLCVWAYISERRLTELKHHFGDEISLSHHFIPLFGCTEKRIGEGWHDRGGFGGYSAHVRKVCADYPHVEVHEAVWQRDIPKTSALTHQYLKSVQLLEEHGRIPAGRQAQFAGNTLFEELAWRARQAFFRDARDISDMAVMDALSAELDLPVGAINEMVRRGDGMAAMCGDMELREEYHVEGSPTYILNEGRQKLYGNVGYRIIEANVQEILRRPGDQATWC
jgi:predicted DsbA family dithiol-disulfide isomerase